MVWEQCNSFHLRNSPYSNIYHSPQNTSAHHLAFIRMLILLLLLLHAGSWHIS